MPSDTYDGDLIATLTPSFANRETEAQRDEMLASVHIDVVLCHGAGSQCLIPGSVFTTEQPNPFGQFLHSLLSPPAF